MQRPDKEIIRLLDKEIRQGGRCVNWRGWGKALNLPLISLTEPLFFDGPVGVHLKKTFNMDPKKPFENKDGTFNFPDEALLEPVEPVFDEFVFHCKDKVRLTGEKDELVVTQWGIFLDPRNHLTAFKNLRINHPQKCSTACKYLFLVVQYEDRPKSIFIWQGLVDRVMNDEGEIDDVAIPNDLSKEYWGDKIAGLNSHAVAAYVKTGMVWHYAKYGDKHLVEVVPTKPKAPKKSSLYKNRPWLTANGPHILFLDRMPTTQKKGIVTGTHASPKPHRRRGHWKTLNHPRFRHHPQYQQKIYVKPSFVGPRQTTYEGNIYRLVQPLEERLS